MRRAHREFDRRQDRRSYQVSRESQTSNATDCVGRIASLTGGKTAGVTRFCGSHRLEAGGGMCFARLL
ncbi:hypothetical protein SBA3_1010029 [Candidatus Sulfopaludibacter sp. SbA3]|nr:hypothetical protein SBA3_1010029 [Candidatus Sulfopaludibacter sp. SbA3]